MTSFVDVDKLVELLSNQTIKKEAKKLRSNNLNEFYKENNIMLINEFNNQSKSPKRKRLTSIYTSLEKDNKLSIF